MAAWYNIGMGVEIKAYPKDGKGQSEKYKDYEYRKCWHAEMLAREFLKEKGKRHF